MTAGVFQACVCCSLLLAMSRRENPHKPYNFIRNCVAYTGTHDNDTTAGWFSEQNEQSRHERDSALKYMGSDGREPVGDLIRLLLSSVADTAIVPMQDYLGLGTEARMKCAGNNGPITGTGACAKISCAPAWPKSCENSTAPTAENKKARSRKIVLF